MRESEERRTTDENAPVCMGHCHAFSNPPHWQVLTVNRGAEERASKRPETGCDLAQTRSPTFLGNSAVAFTVSALKLRFSLFVTHCHTERLKRRSQGQTEHG
jgi:hypothetical protein